MDILNIGDLRASKYLKVEKRKAQLDTMILCCTVTYKALLHIDHPQRVRITNFMDKMKSELIHELERIK